MNIRYQLGNLLNKVGFRMARTHRWPEVHGNLLLLGFSLVRAKNSGLGDIQILQVGAFDGHARDPLEIILGDERVTAVLVEPQSAPYASLINRYGGNPRIRIVNTVVGEFDGQVTLYVPSAEASPKASVIAKHHKRFGIKKSQLREVVVPSLTVTSLLKQCQIKHLDILQLDTEGMDYRILTWFFAAGIEPAVINFESLHLDKNERQASRDLLRGKGYWWIDSHQDTFAIKESLVRMDK